MEVRQVTTVSEPKKRIAMFLDGTWNTVENNTNVWRLYSLCSKSGEDGMAQIFYYTKGVGTTYGEKVRGGIGGYGIDEIIRDAYEWLIAHYNPDDEIFVFGFSRGAYAARSLVGLVARCGILRPGSPIGVGELYSRYLLGDSAKTLYGLLDDRIKELPPPTSLIERWMLTYSAPAAIKMIGVWDTVGALRGHRGVLETGLRRSVENAFHALAVDEHRPSFAPTLWTRNIHNDQPLTDRPPKRDLTNVEQRWFVGAHANVGGGYASDLLPQIALQWVMKKASALGLAFRENIKEDDGVYECIIRNSFKDFAYGAYYAAMFGRGLDRPIGAPAVQAGAIVTETVNETIDISVFERWRRDADYKPANLAAWATRHGVTPEVIIASVRADDPGVIVAETP